MALRITRAVPRRAEATDLARVVIQMERHPFAFLQSNAPRPMDSEEGEVRTEFALSFPMGNQPCVWEVSCRSDRGAPVPLPGPYANDIIVALGRKWNEHRRDHVGPGLTEDQRTITLSRTELLELMGRERGGPQYEALDETIDRLLTVSIHTQHTWRVDGGYVEDVQGVNIFERIARRRPRHAPERTTYTFVFSPTYARALASNRDSRLLDTRIYRELRSDLARRLLRYLDAERYQTDHQGAAELVVDLAALADRLPLIDRRPANLLRSLAAAHRELVAHGYLAVAPGVADEAVPADRRRRRYKLTYAFGHTAIARPEGSGRRAPRRLSGGGPAQALGGEDAADLPGPRFLAAGAAIPPDERAPLSDRVAYLERMLADRGSAGFFKLAVERLPWPLITAVLGDVQQGAREQGFGLGIAARTFRTRLVHQARELGVSLDASPRRGGRQAVNAGDVVADLFTRPPEPAAP